MDSISEEESDEAIRSALQDLPRDLYTTFERYLSATMYARSPDRTQLMSRILGSNESFTVCPVRCIQLWDWKLAEELLRRRGVGKNLKRYVSRTPVLHFCADAGDLEGVELLLRHHLFNVNALATGVEIFGTDTPIQTALKSQRTTLGDLQRIIDTAIVLIDRGADSQIPVQIANHV